MWPKFLPPSLSSIGIRVPEQMQFQDFHDGRPAILNLFVAPMLPIKFRLNPTWVWEEMSFKELQDDRHGGNLGYRNETILAFLNICVAVIPPIKFGFNPTYGY